jgi:glutamyl-tRNA reductase
MKTLEIHVPEDVAAKIEQAAEHKGLSLDELVRVSIEEKLARDDQFEKAAQHVLTKNAELYERLS